MKTQCNIINRRKILIASVMAASLGRASVGLAGALYQWSGAAGTGSATSWGIASNWGGGFLPVANSDVMFSGSFQSGLSISLAGAVPVARFTIDTDKSFSLNPDVAAGANTLTLSQGRIDRTSTSSGTQTFAASVVQQVAGQWDIRGSGALVVSGVVSGSTITKTGNGTLILSGINTHASTIVNGGTLQITAQENLGAAGGTLELGNGALAVFGSVGIDHPVRLAGTGTVSIPSGTVYLQGGIHGNGTLVKAGPGRMRLFGNGINTYTGNVINLEGQLLTNFSSLRGNVTNYGELQLSQTTTGTYSSNINGTGSVVVGGGSVTFTGSNAFSGGMFINDTTVNVSADANLGAASGTVILNNNASVLRMTADFSSNRPFVFNTGTNTINYNAGVSGLYGPMTGPGTLVKSGAGEIEITNVRTGGLIVKGGGIDFAYNGTFAGTGSVSVLGISGAGSQVDLANNHLIVDHAANDSGAAYANVKSLILSGRNGGAWNGSGLMSSTARDAASHITGLGMLRSSDFTAASGTQTFGGLTADSSAVLVKYTYYGDTDLNGVVDFDDYSRTDSGFNNGGTDWFHGDFDYNGVVDFDDYSLIDLAFNTQSGSLRRAIQYIDGSDRSAVGMNTPALRLVQQHFVQLGQSYANGFLNAVPEPGSAISFSGLATLAASVRRRRTH